MFSAKFDVAVIFLFLLHVLLIFTSVNTYHKNSRNNPAVNPWQIQEFLKALAAGITVVLIIQSINTILGAAILSRPPYLPHPFDAMKWFKGCVQLLLLVVKGFTAATFVVFVEELLFRSWMPNEIAIDTGYHQSIIITGLVFALFQRYLSLFQSCVYVVHLIC